MDSLKAPCILLLLGATEVEVEILGAVLVEGVAQEEPEVVVEVETAAEVGMLGAMVAAVVHPVEGWEGRERTGF